MARIVEAFEDEDSIYIVLEFCSGGDLQMFMNNRGFEPLDEARAKDLVFKIAQGLKYLHDRNIIHRDIKPENILMRDVGSNTMPIITDFGFSKILKNDTDTCSMIWLQAMRHERLHGA